MDEGFTQYSEDRITAWLNSDTGFAQQDNYASYYSLAKSNKEEPLTTHGRSLTNTNFAYGNAVYSKVLCLWSNWVHSWCISER
jgi:hypothetical protein